MSDGFLLNIEDQLGNEWVDGGDVRVNSSGLHHSNTRFQTRGRLGVMWSGLTDRCF